MEENKVSDCSVDLLEGVLLFVNEQEDKSKDKIFKALRSNFGVDEPTFESLIRVNCLKEYRGVDDRGNGVDFIAVGAKGEKYLRVSDPSFSIKRVRDTETLKKIEH